MSAKRITATPLIPARFATCILFLGTAVIFCLMTAPAQTTSGAAPVAATPAPTDLEEEVEYPHDATEIGMPGDTEEDVNASFAQPGQSFLVLKFRGSRHMSGLSGPLTNVTT